MLTDAELRLAHEYGTFVEFADRMGLSQSARDRAEWLDKERTRQLQQGEN